MDSDLNVAICTKGRETYVVLYPDKRFAQALGVLAGWACDPDLSFTAMDAGRVALRMKEMATEGSKT